MDVDFDVFLFRDASGAFIARVPALTGCHSWGHTEEDALRNVEDAIQLALQDDGTVLQRVGVKTVHVDA